MVPCTVSTGRKASACRNLSARVIFPTRGGIALRKFFNRQREIRSWKRYFALARNFGTSCEVCVVSCEFAVLFLPLTLANGYYQPTSEIACKPGGARHGCRDNAHTPAARCAYVYCGRQR